VVGHHQLLLLLSFLLDLSQLVEHALVVVQDALVLVNPLELVLHPMQRIEDGGLGLVVLQRTATAGQSVAFLIQGTEVVQVLLDLLAVARVMAHSGGRQAATAHQKFVDWQS
jgi:hypothetical protein